MLTWRGIAVLSILVVGSAIARADEPKGPPVTKVELRENPGFAKTGKVAIYKGQADQVGVAFFLEGIGIGTPVAVFLASSQASPMKLQLKNDMSEKWERTIERDPKTGVAEGLFRTEGSAMVLVTSKSGPLANYELVIWVGRDIPLHKLQRPPFVSQAAFDKKQPGGIGPQAGGGSSSSSEVIIAIVVVLGLVGGFVWVARRRMKKGRAA